MKKITVSIIPGWAEGPAHFSKFRKTLVSYGYKLVDSPQACDIVVAHSAGCYYVPANTTAKLIMLIDPAVGLIDGAALKEVRSRVLKAPEQIELWGIAAWIRLRLLNCFYLLFNMPRNYKTARLVKKDRIVLPDKTKIIVVHNLEDKDHRTIFDRIQKSNSRAMYEELAGLHEDCVINPEPYIDLLLKELK